MAHVTVEQLAREVVGSLDMEDGYVIAQLWISRRYQEIAARLRLKSLQKAGEITLPGRINSGVVTVTRESQTVTGSQTAWPESIVGSYFRRERNWYVIASRVSETSLLLASPYAEPSAAGVGYTIVKRFHSLPSGARQVEEFVNRRSGSYLTALSSAEMDIIDPVRHSVSDFTAYAIELGAQENSPQPDTRVFEFYPYPVNSTLISFLYYDTAPDLKLDDLIPDTVDAYVLKEGVMIDAFRFAMARSLKEGRVDVAAVWRNEMRAQETSWQRRMIEAAQADQAVDANTVVLSRYRGGSRGVCN